HEIHRHLDAGYRGHASLLFLATSAAAFGVLSRALSWRAARWPAYTILPAAAAAGLYDLAWRSHPFAALGWVAWPIAFGLHAWMLKRYDGEDPAVHHWLHAAGLWLLAVVGSWELGWQIDHVVSGQRVWLLIAWAVVPGLLLVLLTSNRASRLWPISTHPQ